MHRDYRHGQFTQIIRYDNRIEICNSGCSLKPDDMLGMKGSVTRNDTIARVCHDTKLAETKGSGIDRMWRKMVEAGLSRPTMESDRTASTFTIRLLLCHFFSEESMCEAGTNTVKSPLVASKPPLTTFSTTTSNLPDRSSFSSSSLANEEVEKCSMMRKKVN